MPYRLPHRPDSQIHVHSPRIISLYPQIYRVWAYSFLWYRESVLECLSMINPSIRLIVTNSCSQELPDAYIIESIGYVQRVPLIPLASGWIRVAAQTCFHCFESLRPWLHTLVAYTKVASVSSASSRVFSEHEC